ncbi:hypothetical protein M3891_003015 [Vibrio metschnikovii]|nr:hypothetical protein [Vibrio metschnikovii]
MVTVNKTRVKKLKDALQAQLNLIAAKYNVEHHELDCESMTKEDYEHYVALDHSVQLYKEMLGCNDDVVIVDNL